MKIKEFLIKTITMKVIVYLLIISLVKGYILLKKYNKKSLFKINNNNNLNINKSNDLNINELKKELNELQNELYYIQALELRNEAQFQSFVSKEAQWLAQDEYDRIMLNKKSFIELRIDEIYILLNR